MLRSLLFLPPLFSLFNLIDALPRPTPTSPDLAIRDYQPGDVPYFRSDIPSCVACEPEWSSISSCADAAPAFQVRPVPDELGISRSGHSSVSRQAGLEEHNPLSFVSVIKCACTDTFISAYPQCVNCFAQTNQCEQFLGVPSEQNASSILDGIRNVCGFGGALLGGVAASHSSAGIPYTYNASLVCRHPFARLSYNDLDRSWWDRLR
ncbi:hypothetical protein JCM11641_004991 [Rhodosporidiobolus odoratus]